MQLYAPTHGLLVASNKYGRTRETEDLRLEGSAENSILLLLSFSVLCSRRVVCQACLSRAIVR